MNKIIHQLTNIAKEYLKTKGEFFEVANSIKDTFKLTKKQIKEIDFGIIETYDHSLQKFCDILNNDEQLIRLSNRMRKLMLKGNLIIINGAIKHESKLPGYCISKFIQNPEGNNNEIEDFIQGLYGYQHIHIINDKIMFELPVRYAIINDKKLLDYVDIWIKELGMFYEA